MTTEEMLSRLGALTLKDQYSGVKLERAIAAKLRAA